MLEPLCSDKGVLHPKEPNKSEQFLAKKLSPMPLNFAADKVKTLVKKSSESFKTFKDEMDAKKFRPSGPRPTDFLYSARTVTSHNHNALKIRPNQVKH